MAFILKAGGAEAAGKIIPLEALRGAAALVVVVHHFIFGFLPFFTASCPERSPIWRSPGRQHP